MDTTHMYCEAEVSKLKEKVKEFKKKARVSNNDFKREKDKADFLGNNVLSWRRSCEKSEEENEKLKKENESLKDEIMTITSERDDITHERDDLHGYEEEYKKLELENEELKKYKDLEKDILVSDVNEKQDKISSLKILAKLLEERIEELEEISDEYDDYHSQSIHQDDDEYKRLYNLEEENEKLKDFSEWENHPALRDKIVVDRDYYMEKEELTKELIQADDLSTKKLSYFMDADEGDLLFLKDKYFLVIPENLKSECPDS